MPVYKAEAIVIRRRNLGEADRIVTLFSREYGKFSVVAKGARKPGSRFAGRLELFTQLHALLARGRTLDVVSQVDVIDPFAGLRGDLARMGAASTVVEITDRATPERETQSALYTVLRDALRTIATGDAEMPLLWFTTQVLVLIGYAPVVDRCVVCGRPLSTAAAFSAALGGSLCASHRGRDPEAVGSSAAALAAVGFLREAGVGALARVTLDRRLRAELARLLRPYLEYRLDVRLRSPLVTERMTESTEY